MMNPIFFFPMILSPLLMGFTAWGLTSLIDLSNYNPTITLPWTTPSLITLVLRGGLSLLAVGLVIVVVSFITWYPFFKVADKKAVADEIAG